MNEGTEGPPIWDVVIDHIQNKRRGRAEGDRSRARQWVVSDQYQKDWAALPDALIRALTDPDARQQ